MYELYILERVISAIRQKIEQKRIRYQSLLSPARAASMCVLIMYGSESESGRESVCVCVWMDGWMDGWMDEWMVWSGWIEWVC